MGRLERLKIIKSTPYLITDKVLTTDFKWLIEQAEKVPSLESYISTLADSIGGWVVKSRRDNAEIEKLREALAFYENPDNYSYAMDECENPQPYDCVILGDCGQVAKSALEETK